MKRHSIATLAILLSFSAMNGFAQNWAEIKQDKKTYLSGEGWGNTVDEADKQALADLISQISVIVSHDFAMIEDENTKNGQLDATNYVSSKVNTYSQSTLTNTQRIVLENEPDAHVGRYIKRSELSRIFEGRKLKLSEFVRLGEKAEKNYKAADALRYYYWAFSLLKTLQYPNEETYTDSEGTTHHLATWLPAVIDAIFQDLNASIVRRNGDDLELAFTFRGKPVVNLDYTYFDGRDWSNIYSAKDGRGVLEMMPGSTPENVQLKVEYAYRGEAHIDREVETVLKVVRSNALRKSYITIPLDNKAEPNPAVTVKPNAAKPIVATQNNDSCTSSLTEMTDDAAYRQKTDAVIAAIRSSNYEAAKANFTDEGFQMYQQLISYGKARIVGTPNYKVFSKAGAVVVRSVPMSFSFEKGARKSFVEDVVFTFNETGKIDCIAFALDKTAANDIITQGYWPESARMTILEFMENYKTAYCLKRLDYIESIFDDEALIIVGKVVKQFNRVGSGDTYEYANHHAIKKTKYTKETYLKHLAACFGSNECINIRFTSNDVVRAGKGGEVYGIQIKQDYYSTNYGDTGYLFLMVDLNNPDEPIIKVRTWQEKPDPVEGLYDLMDF